ncbi:MAG: bifunctional phosphopantothenoylcysteine decarboxylase/phosphopantothenate--cysteine ligase CoaBC [Methanomassiliicoccales archaeon]|nr:MAG: bifunctional phosphopantothenoylcysteine decarboxylase/phosphopantothenate--cysteine ligase CoaBC [Methanomassiliicoccales archaeon]
MHPSQAIYGAKDLKLKGKKIVLGITGSIAAIECVELARELIRHGAEVQAVMTSEALKILTPWSMEFATGRPVVTEIDGRVQHVDLFGDSPDRADLLLIAPCTANTISKIACGIDDTTVTTMATVAIGSKVPVLIAPAMHASMYDNPFVKKNIGILRDAGIRFVGPRFEGGKAKIADKEHIVEAVIRVLGDHTYKGKRVLVIGGSSEEMIDDMRLISNRGTGETAVELAKAAYEKGATVELWMGRCSVPLPSFLNVKRFRTVEDLVKMVDQVDHDLVIVPAALSDYGPVKKKGKVPSDKGAMRLELRPLPKVLPLLCASGTKVIGFKAESGAGEADLAKIATDRCLRSGADAMVANDLSDVGPGFTKVMYVEKDGAVTPIEGTKSSVARQILDLARRLL